MSLAQERFEQQLLRQFKYVNDPNDIQECEREVSRMLLLIRNLFFDSKNLLVSFVMQSGDVNMLRKVEGVKTYLNNKKSLNSSKEGGGLCQSQSDKLINLFAQVLEELGPTKALEGLLCDCLMTMITFASQNVKFKNSFVQPITVST